VWANGEWTLHSGSGFFVFKEVNISGVIEAVFRVYPVVICVISGTAGGERHTWEY
jgi:hypothetical protein